MDNNLQINQNAEQTYHSIRQSIVSAQHRLSAAVNSTMVITYWEIGEQIYKACGEMTEQNMERSCFNIYLNS